LKKTIGKIINSKKIIQKMKETNEKMKRNNENK
jgi:hypothetical protein